MSIQQFHRNLNAPAKTTLYLALRRICNAESPAALLEADGEETWSRWFPWH